MSARNLDFYVQNDPGFREFYKSQGFRPGQRVPRAQLQATLDQYLMQQPVEDAATGVFDGLPDAALAEPPLPPTAGAPPSNFSGLVPEDPNPLNKLAEQTPDQATEPQQNQWDKDSLLGVLGIRQLSRKELPGRGSKNWDPINNKLIREFVDTSEGLSNYGIYDISTFDNLADAPRDVQARAINFAEQQIREGREPDWDLALKRASAQEPDASGATKELTDVDRTADSLKRDTNILPEGDPSIAQRQQRLSRLNQQELALEIARNPQEQRDIALAVQNAVTSNDLEGQNFEVNLSKLEASQRVIRDNDDKQVAMLRGILGEAAGNSTNVMELTQTLNDDQARKFAAMRREAGITDTRPGAVVIRPGVMTNEEIRKNLAVAAQYNSLVLEVNEDKKKGMTATSGYLDAKSYNALMDRFKDPEEAKPKPTPSKKGEGSPDISLDSPDVLEALEDRIAALDPESEEAKTLRIKLNEYRKGKEARDFLATQVLPGMKEGLLKIVPPPSEWARAGGALLRGAKAVR